MQEQKPMLTQVNEIHEALSDAKKKRIKIPRKAKVRKGKMKKGYVGVIYVDENGNLKGDKAKIQDSSFREKKGPYHATDGREILYWEGKFPVIIQPKWKNNPVNLRKDSKNETYGQPYLMARMLGDVIKVKNRGGGMIIWIILGIVGAYIASQYLGGA